MNRTAYSVDLVGRKKRSIDRKSRDRSGVRVWDFCNRIAGNLPGVLFLPDCLKDGLAGEARWKFCEPLLADAPRVRSLLPA